MRDSTREQWRAVPLDTVRERAQAECERSSVRAVAERIGVGRTTLLTFLRGANPHPRTRRTLALWHLREAGGMQVDAEACEVLLAALPPDRRAGAVRELQDFVRELHTKHRRGME